jgi:hypothetical protein
MNTVKRHALIVVVAGIILWYGFLLCLPKIGHGGLAFPEQVKSYMKQMACSGASYEQVRSAISDFTWRRGDIEYVPDLSKRETGWVLTARPTVSHIYLYPLWKRLLFLDFYECECPSFRIAAGEQHVIQFTEQEPL